MAITASADGGDAVSLNTNSGDVVLNINDPGGNMASRGGPVTININVDVEDTNQVFGLLGPGLIAVEQQIPTKHKQIEVSLGEGLMFNANKQVAVQASTGLMVDTNNNLLVNVGAGLVVNAQNQVTTTGSQVNIIGQGLVINPTDGLIDVNVGEGLEINGQNQLVATGLIPGVGPGLIIGTDGDIEVSVGAGLGIDESGALTAIAEVPNLGAGLILGTDGDTEVNVGVGLDIDGNGALTVDLGDGLDIDGNGALTVDLGTGLAIDTNGRLAVDNTNPGINQTIKVMIDSQYSFRDSVLYIAKVFTTYNVVRADTGAVVSIDAATTSVETDTVSFSNGYGMAFGPVVPNRVPDPKKPSFYKT